MQAAHCDCTTGVYTTHSKMLNRYWTVVECGQKYTLDLVHNALQKEPCVYELLCLHFLYLAGARLMRGTGADRLVHRERRIDVADGHKAQECCSARASVVMARAQREARLVHIIWRGDVRPTPCYVLMEDPRPEKHNDKLE